MADLPRCSCPATLHVPLPALPGSQPQAVVDVPPSNQAGCQSNIDLENHLPLPNPHPLHSDGHISDPPLVPLSYNRGPPGYHSHEQKKLIACAEINSRSDLRAEGGHHDICARVAASALRSYEGAVTYWRKTGVT